MKTRSILLTTLILLAATCAQAQGDWTIADIYPLDYQVPGTKSFNVAIENVSNSGISSYDISWQLDNGPTNTVSKTAFDTKWSGKKGLVQDAAFKITLPAMGNYQLKVWIHNTSPADINATNDAMTKTIHVYETLPKKNVVLEVFKHQNCGPCYPAATYTTKTVTPNPDYAVVHIYTANADVLQNADGAMVNNTYGFAHPMPVFDRYKFPFTSGLGTGFSSGSQGMTLKGYGEREQFYEPVRVFMQSVDYNESKRELKVKVGAQFYDNLVGDYRFNLYLTEDSVKAYQASAPDPNNYYHKSVLRAMLGGAWGKQGSLPTSISNNDVKYYDFTYTIPADYNTDKMHLIALVQNYTGDKYNRRILNSEQKTFSQAVALAVPEAATIANNISIHPNPAKEQITVVLDNKKQYHLTLMNMTGKVIYSLPNCTKNTTINMASLPTGNYILHADDGQVVYTKKIVKE